MKIKNLMTTMAVAVFAMTSLNANAGNVDAAKARTIANQFIHQQNAKGLFNAHTADLVLVHAEASRASSDANAYYAFNVKGGGFVIIAGEDRAPQVLGYSDKGQLDFNKLPYNLQGLLNGYKQEIEFLQKYEGNDLVPVHQTLNASSGVEPLIKTTWGQEDPYDWQCPKKNGEYCVVGCVATAMAQVMYYWKFPEGSAAISGYTIGGGWWWGGNSLTVDDLPATTFDYSLMLKSYCHWDWNTSQLIQDTYTDAQAQEVAKLGRYCGQAVEMDYDPEGSGAYTDDQLAAMKSFGYRSTAQHVYKNNSQTSQWEAKMRTELDAGRPILYSADDPSEGGHAFICDGYNADGMFHFNLGWYGTCDGWYVSTALNMIHRSGDELHFSTGHEMLIGIQPPEGWEPPTYTIMGDVNMDGDVTIADVTALIDYLLGGDDSAIDIEAANVNGDGDVTIADVTALIDMLLSGDNN
ncbi:MAG: C10 family peptidase [Muribaculaceae bacterium]|nr:C10 family peptidase [Muribaculaceae bacterium]